VEGHRAERVSEALRSELEELICYELQDPRVRVAAVTEVQLAPDMKRAMVRLSLEGDPADRTATIEALEHAKAFLRHQLAERVEMFRIPDLYFEGDMGDSLSGRVPQLLKRIKKGRAK
jgi:ribosome-binding factor A